MMIVSWILMIIGYFCSCLGIILHFDCCAQSKLPSRGMRDIDKYRVNCEGFTFFQSLPFFPANNPATMWTMSLAFPSYSYVIFNSGFSMFLYSICYYIWDIVGLRPVGIFRTLGTNSLLTYIVAGWIGEAWFQSDSGMIPKDSPFAYVLFIGFGLHFGAVWLVIRYCELHKIFIAL